LLQGNSTTSGVNFAWTGPGGFASGLQNPQVSIVGTYTLVVTAPNGCTAQATAIVVSDVNAPVVTTTAGGITCTTTSASISATSSIANSTFLWSGPNGFTSTLATNTVSVAGIYLVEVTSPNNCKTTSTATVINDTSVPSVAIALGTVDCAASTRMLMATSSQSNPTFAWAGPNGFTSTLPNPSITIAGTYIATNVGSNGCIGQNNIVITNDITYTHQITSTDATTTTGGTASIAITGGTPPFNIVWDNEQAGTSATNLTAGNHNVIVVDGLACTKVIPFAIMGPVGTKEDQLAQQITLSPNPATDRIELISAFSQEMSYTITNSLGQSLTNPVKYQDGIDVTALRTGIYVLKISVDGKSVSKKFIKI
jgi:Secretion system C-terminal sorting domain